MNAATQSGTIYPLVPLVAVWLWLVLRSAGTAYPGLNLVVFGQPPRVEVRAIDAGERFWRRMFRFYTSASVLLVVAMCVLYQP